MKEKWSLFCKQLEVLPLFLTTQGVSSPGTKDTLESRKASHHTVQRQVPRDQEKSGRGRTSQKPISTFVVKLLVKGFTLGLPEIQLTRKI